jgi:DNA-directed RNA polymerase sigma subunit (sigma70/sigma32)
MTSSNTVHPRVMREFQGEVVAGMNQTVGILNEVLLQLEDRDRAIVLLRTQDYSLEQIGQALGLSREGVRKAEARAYEKLKGFMSDLRIHSLREIM